MYALVIITSFSTLTLLGAREEGTRPIKHLDLANLKGVPLRAPALPGVISGRPVKRN